MLLNGDLNTAKRPSRDVKIDDEKTFNAKGIFTSLHCISHSIFLSLPMSK